MKPLKSDYYKIAGICRVNDQYITTDGHRMHISAEKPPENAAVYSLEEYARGFRATPELFLWMLRTPYRIVTELDAGELYGAVKRAWTFSREECSIEAKADSVVISANGDDGSTKTSLNAEVKTEFRVQVNSKYLLDAVNHCGKKGKLYLCIKNLEWGTGISEVPMLAVPGFTKWAFIMPIIH